MMNFNVDILMYVIGFVIAVFFGWRNEVNKDRASQAETKNKIAEAKLESFIKEVDGVDNVDSDYKFDPSRYDK